MTDLPRQKLRIKSLKGEMKIYENKNFNKPVSLKKLFGQNPPIERLIKAVAKKYGQTEDEVWRQYIDCIQN